MATNMALVRCQPNLPDRVSCCSTADRSMQYMPYNSSLTTNHDNYEKNHHQHSDCRCSLFSAATHHPLFPATSGTGMGNNRRCGFLSGGVADGTRELISLH